MARYHDLNPMKVSELRKGQIFSYDQSLYQVKELERSSPQGRGGKVRYRLMAYRIPGGVKRDFSLDADLALTDVDIIRRPATFSYRDGQDYVFLDDGHFTPYPMSPENVGIAARYLTEGLNGLFVQLLDEQPVAVQLPQTVVLSVVETPPEIKGGTATKRPKPATLSTGIDVMVPEYIRTGERIFVNTDTGTFSGRAD